MSRPDYPKAAWVPSPNYWQGRDPRGVLAIVYHTEAGHEAGTDAEFQNPNAQVSAHYSVALDGTVRQFVDEASTAWHAGGQWPDGTNANLLTIGVEREDGGDPSTPMTEAQAASWKALMTYLCAKYSVPRQIAQNGQRGLISHHLVNPDHAGCAGPAVESVAQQFCQEADAVDTTAAAQLVVNLYLLRAQHIAATNHQNADPAPTSADFDGWLAKAEQDPAACVHAFLDAIHGTA